MSDYKQHGQNCYQWKDWYPCGCPRCEPPEHKYRTLAKLKRFTKRTMARNRRRSKDWMRDHDANT